MRGYGRRPTGIYGQRTRRSNARYRHVKIKKIKLPPTNLKGVETYLRNKGYRINPSLQGNKPGAKLTFDKPLADGKRLHGDVHLGRNRIKINQHVDKHDPYRNPIGHLLEDCTTKIRSSISVVPKKK
jgi:hypothetical protein